MAVGGAVIEEVGPDRTVHLPCSMVNLFHVVIIITSYKQKGGSLDEAAAFYGISL